MFEILLVAGMAGCFIGAVVLAMAEVAIIRVRRSEVLVAARSGSVRSVRLLRLLDDLPLVLNTVLLLVLLLHVSAATIGGVLAGRWFGGVGVTAMTALLTIVLFVYAEAIPKTKAVNDPHRMALRLTAVLSILVRLMHPVVVALVWLAERQIGEHPISPRAVTEDELRALAQESAEVGAIERSDAELVDRSFEFNDLLVRDVMTPRAQMVVVSDTESVSSALDRAITHGHRRLPVTGDDIDDIVGVIRLRDLAASARSDPDAAAGPLSSEVLRCEQDSRISELLTRMQRSGHWLAVARSSTGRVVGLVTVEDLVAELVGEIEDDRRAIRRRDERR